MEFTRRKDTRHDVRTTLRRDTRELHEQAESCIRRHAPIADIDGLERYLQSMRRVHEEFRPELARIGNCIGLEDHSETIDDAIQADLAWLTSRSSRLRARPGPVAEPRKAVAEPAKAVAEPWNAVAEPWRAGSPGEALGALYVLEGSGLGARVLLSQLRRSALAGAPLAYLEHLAAGIEHRWPAVVTALDSVDDAAASSVLAGAKHAFRRVIAHVRAIARVAERRGACER